MTIAYISIGSNLSSPEIQVRKAILALDDIPKSCVIAISSYYRTLPLGPLNQPDYLNTAIALQTSLDAYSLLENMQRIELQQGRERKIERWGARTIDLDLMLFGNYAIHTERLIIPHYDMHNRGFMLWPLIEIAPKLYFPNGKMLKEILVFLGEKKPSYW